MTLWAIERPLTDEVIAAPSFEAALAACDDFEFVRPWPFCSAWHSDEVRHFLLCVDAEAIQ